MKVWIIGVEDFTDYLGHELTVIEPILVATGEIEDLPKPDLILLAESQGHLREKLPGVEIRLIPAQHQQ